MPAKEHILVVEDEAHLAMGIKYNLVAEGYRVTVVGGQFKCGSVLFPKDPRNRVGNRAQIPPKLRRAYSACQNTSNDRTHTAITFLLVGVIPLLIVLTLPALSRRSRRSRSRRRTRF